MLWSDPVIDNDSENTSTHRETPGMRIRPPIGMPLVAKQEAAAVHPRHDWYRSARTTWRINVQAMARVRPVREVDRRGRYFLGKPALHSLERFRRELIAESGDGCASIMALPSDIRPRLRVNATLTIDASPAAPIRQARHERAWRKR